MLTIECSEEPDQDMSPQCTGAGSLAMAQWKTAIHWWWCKGHVRVYNCAGMWPLQQIQIFYRIPLILLPQHNLTVPQLNSAASLICVCHRVLPGAWRVFSDFRAKHCSIATLQSSIRASARCSTAACILPRSVLSNLFVAAVSPYSGQMTPSIDTRNIEIEA